MLESIRSCIQFDAGNRGLADDPQRNLLTETAGDFAAACVELAEVKQPSLVVVTGFLIPHATPPAAETDGPLGALFLARALQPLGFRVAIAAEAFCLKSLQGQNVSLIELPVGCTHRDAFQRFLPDCTHLIALERVGPNHTTESVGEDQALFEAEVEPHLRNRCYSMRGLDITANMAPAHWWFERPDRTYRTIGIGDGGNEIGMGKVSWATVRRNINRGGLVACRVPTDLTIVAGISNWGAYGLAAGIYHLKGVRPDAELFDRERERSLLEILVRQGPLVDGVTGLPTVSVDGLAFEQYATVLEDLARLVPQ